MPPKKALAKKRTAAKKAAAANKKASAPKASPKKPNEATEKASSSAKKTPSKPAGVMKNKTPSKSASAAKKPASGRALRSADSVKKRTPIYKTANDAKKHVEADIRRFIGAGSSESNAIWVNRAAELYRHDGMTATEKHGSDNHQLMNACLGLAWKEGDWSILPGGNGHYTDDTKYRIGRVDEGHDPIEWVRLCLKLKNVIEPLMQEIQNAKQKANMKVPMPANPSSIVMKAATKAQADLKKRPAKTGSAIKKSASASKKASVKKIPSKSPGISEKTPSKTTTSARKK